MKALVEESGRVAQVVANDKTFPVALPLRWVDAPAGVMPEYAYDGQNFFPPEPEPDAVPDPNAELDAALEAAFAKIEAATTVAGVKAGLADLKTAMLGEAGRAGRIAGRPV